MNFGATVYNKCMFTLQIYEKNGFRIIHSNMFIIFFKCQKLIDSLALKHD